LTFDADKKQAPVMDSERFLIRPCTPKDVNRMVEIYKKVFLSYPFPIHEDEYILKTMKDNIDYFCVETEGEIIALSSAEKDNADLNAEMTDFATLPEWRGNSLSVHLLQRMEEQVKIEGIKTVYTIARAASPGMNITFARTGYSFGGRLINNTNISGTIESMNVWYKQL
jgi:putative beta-lysine N-acetyltransferase